MITAGEILEELKPLGSDSYKRVMLNHGVREPYFGVKISDMKGIVKRIGKDYQLALDLYATGNYDAMYLAGLIAEDTQMTELDLQRWVTEAYCPGLGGATVAWVAAGSHHGWKLGLDWIESNSPLIASAGWSTLVSLISVRENHQLDLPAIERLLERVKASIHQAPDLVRYHMNSFVIAVGCYMGSHTHLAIKTAEEIGKVIADLGNNSCQVPSAQDSIRKVQERGRIGKKRKSAKC